MTSVLVLAAGYGTRLQRDLSAAPSYAHLLDIPKPLLPLADCPLINHWLALFDPASFFVVCNNYYYKNFLDWAVSCSFPSSNIFNDRSNTIESRLGSCVDMSRAILHFDLSVDVLVIAGDTLFLNDFDVQEFIKTARSIQCDCVVTSYSVSDEQTKKYGILDVEPSLVNDKPYNRVVRLLEKPGPDATDSRLACPAFYYLKPKAVKLLHEYVADHEKLGLEYVDAAGRFLSWMVERASVYAIPCSGRLDIGGLDSYLQADKYLREGTFE